MSLTEAAFEFARTAQRHLNTLRYKDFLFKAEREDAHVFLVVYFKADDTRTGEPYDNISRRWFLSPHMTFSEIIKTAWLAVSQVEEHERRENFIVLDAVGNPCRPFNPHYSIEGLMKLKSVEYGLYAEKDAS